MQTDSGLSITADGRQVQLSNPEKRLFPESGITKRDLAEYYLRVAPYMLPFVRERPLTLQRFPEGIDKDGFYQKQAPDYLPDWIRTVRLPKSDGHTDHMLINDAATLIWLANQAMITPHVGLHRADDRQHPDQLIFDLDPPDATPDAFADVRFAALRLSDALTDLGLVPYVKTTGSKGLHVVVPLTRTVDFDEARAFAQELSRRLAERHPERLTTEQRIAKRGRRVYLDCLRNAYGQTAVAPYGVRARPNAPVATPLEWHEVNRAELGPQRYTVRNLFRRIGQKGACPWADMPKHARALPALPPR
ncbi:MAG: non-homologous end-joining DNA ligase [Pseudomonadales bacterium]|jgi:bifunctional non-homologous end joining protein LigD